MTLQLTKQTLSIAGHKITFELPASQDQLLEEAIRNKNSGSSDWDPYWGSLWETSPKTAEIILNHQWPSGLKSLELGCGIGVTGIAALIAGHEVTFSDHATAAVKLAISNAGLNGFPSATGTVFDWQQSSASLQYDFVFGSDVLYETVSHQPLLNTIQRMLKVDGIAWIGDAGRTNAERFAELAISQRWNVETNDEHGEPSDAPRHLQFRIYILKPPIPNASNVQC
jgi:predicted nicotinamide N-methyase